MARSVFEQYLMDRRALLKGGAALGAAGVMAGGATAIGLEQAMAQDLTTLNFYHDKTPWDDFFKGVGDLAKDAINVTWETSAYGDTTSYQAAVTGALPTKDTPDMFTWWSGFRIEDLYNQGVLEDVTDIWTQGVADGNLPESLATGFTFNGTQCAIPTAASFWVTFYNKKVFADNGLEVPTTWAEYQTVCETLKAAGVTPLASTTNGRWPAFIPFQDFVLRTDPEFYNKLMAGQAKYTDDTCKAAMTTWKGMLDAGYYTDLDSDMSADWGPAFQAGELAMVPIGTWFQSTFTALDMVPGTDYDIFITPNINDGMGNSVIVEAGALCMAKNSGKLDAAKQMANFWISPDTNTFFAGKLGDTPFNPKSTSENAANAALLTMVSEQSYTLYQRFWEASPVPIVEGAVDFLAGFMLDTSTLDDTLQQIQDLADSEWEKRGGPAAEASPAA